MDDLPHPHESSLGAGVWCAVGGYSLALLAASGATIALRERRACGDSGAGTTVKRTSAQRSGLPDAASTALGLCVALFPGVALVGIAGEAALSGLLTLRWLVATIAVSLGFALVAPRLRRLSDFRGGYVSGVDVVSDRFRDIELRLAVGVVQIMAAFLHLIAQFAAMGATVAALSDGAVPRVVGIAAAALGVLIFEFCGGRQTMSIIDVIQGTMLLVVVGMLFAIQYTMFDGLPAAASFLSSAADSEFSALPRVIDAFSMLAFLLGLASFALFGQVQQRMFAAESERSLRRALSLLPIVSMIVIAAAASTGLVASAFFLEVYGTAPQGGEMFGATVRALLVTTPVHWHNYAFGAIILSVALAIMVTTADSALASISCITCLDVLRTALPRRCSSMPAAKLVQLGRATSMLGCLAAVVLTYALNPGVVSAFLLQQQLLLQIAPCFLAAMYLSDAKSRPLTLGIISGVLGTAIVVAVDVVPIYIAGALGFALNLIVAASLQFVDHYKLVRGSRGDLALWDRFGAPLPAQMIGYRIPQHNSELLHAPGVVVLVGVTLVALVFGIPWFQPSASTGFGLPAWAVMSLAAVLCCAASLALAFAWCWRDNAMEKSLDKLSRSRTHTLTLSTRKEVMSVVPHVGSHVLDGDFGRNDSLDTVNYPMHLAATGNIADTGTSRSVRGGCAGASETPQRTFRGLSIEAVESPTPSAGHPSRSHSPHNVHENLHGSPPPRSPGARSADSQHGTTNSDAGIHTQTEQDTHSELSQGSFGAEFGFAHDLSIVG